MACKQGAAPTVMSAHAPELWALVLAAGASRRLGQAKQNLTMGDETLLQHTVRIASTVAPSRVLTVLGAQATALSRSIGGFWVNNPQWEAGMGSSLACGVAQLPENSAILVLLCDQPRVGADQLTGLVNAWQAQPTQIAAAVYNGRRGVPAIFPPASRAALLALNGDQGARTLLRSAASMTEVSMPEAAVDIDRPADLALLDR